MWCGVKTLFALVPAVNRIDDTATIGASLGRPPPHPVRWARSDGHGPMTPLFLDPFFADLNGEQTVRPNRRVAPQAMGDHGGQVIDVC